MGIFDFFRKRESKFEKEINRKTDINDFFKIDIYNLKNHNPIFIDEETILCDILIRNYRIKLTELELGVFYQVEYAEHVSCNDCTLTFHGLKRSITSELKDFINFCFEKYGYDDFGNGIITKEDYINAANSSFIRSWEDITIENSSYMFNLHIRGVKQE